MTNTQKLLIVAMIILGILVAITLPPSMEFYFEKKNQLDTTEIIGLKDITPESKSDEIIKEIPTNDNSQHEQSNTNLGRIYQNLENSVVQITSTVIETRSNIIINGNPLEQQSSRLGSGFVYDKQGHIITNNHVINGATSADVTFVDGNTYTAKVIGFI